MWKCDLRTVIAPSGYARSSDLRIRSIIKGLLIGRSLDVFFQKRGMTVKKYLRNRGVTSFKRWMTTSTVILGQQRVTRVSKDVKWTLGSSPRVTEEEEESPRVTEEESPRVTEEEERLLYKIKLNQQCVSSTMSKTKEIVDEDNVDDKEDCDFQIITEGLDENVNNDVVEQEVKTFEDDNTFSTQDMFEEGISCILRCFRGEKFKSLKIALLEVAKVLDPDDEYELRKVVISKVKEAKNEK